jgi:hypothetical protein
MYRNIVIQYDWFLTPRNISLLPVLKIII